MEEYIEDEFPFDTHEVREMNKSSFGIQQILFENKFDEAVDSVIKKLLEISRIEDEKHQEWLTSLNYTPKVVTEENFMDTPNEMETYIQIESIDYEQESFFRDQELWVLYEMKIIYLYKHFEINLKSLLKDAFSIESVRRLYRWDTVVQFLRAKNIDPKDIKCYKEMIELKDLNNSFKHSDLISKELADKIQELKNIPFAMDDYIVVTYKELASFYERVHELPKMFLEDLTSKLYSEKYEFDDEKIEEMVEDISLRMEKEDGLKLIGKLQSLYEADPTDDVI